ncbi:transmembrane protein [Pimephales promelas]|nr:transmembrane protein [Pimephales promelas]KAG1961500.1 transmembrane protein [Pimephales promelas]
MSSKVFEIWVLLVTSTIITLSNQSCISKWFDRDNPGGNGDYELLADLLSMFPGEICPNPIDIEAQTTSGQPASQTGNVFQVYNPTTGFSCVNANQGGGVCADYKVRFTCPEEWCSKCRTPWFDRDNPGGVGDYETLSLTLVTYPHQACAQPIAIEVTTISGTPVLPTGNSFQVYDPTEGFACVNAQQTGGCQDYRVRFTCLKSFCLPKCVTRWFDSDNPNTNGGDSELLTTLLSLYPGYICPNPLGIEAQTISGLPASQTGNVFQVYNPTTGFSCVNANQGGGVCADYKVRFTCPEEWCSKCRTPWFDRDNPGGVGDYETLSLTLVTYPHQACAQPIAIEVTTISGTPVLPTGNSFQVYDPTEGFACVNAQQTGGCQDYRVRFTCPKSFCLPKCVTRWFDSDNPNTNGGDSELLTTLLSLYPGYICPNPLGIEAQTISGLPASQTGNVFQVYNPTTGFSCVNANQGGGVCADYKVRFICPEEWCSKCRTPWFDRDNPGGVGDFETLSLTLTTYPLQACAQPIAIEVTTVSGTPVLPGSNFQVYDPLQGFECVNVPLSGWNCQDYKAITVFGEPLNCCLTWRNLETIMILLTPTSDEESLEIDWLWNHIKFSGGAGEKEEPGGARLEGQGVARGPGVHGATRVMTDQGRAQWSLWDDGYDGAWHQSKVNGSGIHTKVAPKDANKLLLNEQANWVHLKEFARKNAANSLSVANMLMGMASILCSLNGHHHAACWLVLIGYLLDLADGAVARQLNACSALGAKLDDFADFTTFGIATSLILRTPSLLDNILCMLYVLSVFTRLCFFSSGIPFMYRGLPCIYSSAILVCVSLLTGGNMAVLRILAVAMIIFMVSQNFYPHDRVLESQAWKKVVYVGGIAMVFCPSFPPACLYYLLWSVSYILFPTTLWSCKV